MYTFDLLHRSTDVINQTHATAAQPCPLYAGALALVSLVGGTCWQTVESYRHPLLFYVSAAARTQLFLCIIDGKVRIAEVMRWEGAAKRQDGQAHCWQPGVGSRAWGSKHCRGWEGSWSNRSSQRSRTKCQPLVNQALPIPRVTFWLANTRKLYAGQTGSRLPSWPNVWLFIIIPNALLVFWFVMKCQFEYAYGRTCFESFELPCDSVKLQACSRCSSDKLCVTPWAVTTKRC